VDHFLLTVALDLKFDFLDHAQETNGKESDKEKQHEEDVALLALTTLLRIAVATFHVGFANKTN
jgi:hypothetical protein